MALDLGTLTGFLDLDASGFDAGLGSAFDKLGEFGGKGAAIAATAGAAIAGALVAGVVGAMNVEAANDKLAAQLGLTAGESERIGKVAGDLYAGAYGDSLSQVNDTIGAVMSSMDGLEQATSETLPTIEDMTKKAIDLATAFDIDVTRAVQVAGQMMTTGLAVDGAQAMDLLTAAMQKVPTAVREDLLDAVDEYGPFMQTLGLEGERGMGLLVAAAEKGMYGIDKTGDALKEFTIRSTDMSAASKVGYDALGLSQEDMTRKILAGGDSASGAFEKIVTGLLSMKDPAAQSQAALALFGTPLEDLSVAEIPKFLGSLTSAQTGLKDTAGAADAMGKTLNDNATTNLESFKRQVTTTFVDFVGGKALPAVNDIAAALAVNLGPALSTAGSVMLTMGNTVQDVSGWLGEHQTTTQVLAGTILALMLPTLVSLTVGYAAAGTAAGISGTVQAAAWLRTQVAALATGAVLAVSYALVVAGWVASASAATASAIAIAAAWVISLGPIALVVAGVALFAAGLVLAWKNSETFRNVVVGAFQMILTYITKYLGAWEFLLRQLGKVPGFGWATTAANAIGRARAEVDGFNAGLDRIPARKSTTVTVTYQQVGSITSVPYRQRAVGGPVDPYSTYLVGENGPELLTLGSTRGKVTPAAATAAALSEDRTGGTMVGLLERPAPTINVQARVFVGDRELTDMIRVEVDDTLADVALGATVGLTGG